MSEQIDRKLQKFLTNYEIRVESDQGRHSRYTRMPPVDFFKHPSDASLCESNYAMEHEKLFTVSIPESRLRSLVELEDRISRYHEQPGGMDLLTTLMDKERQESALRHQNEGIRLAYEQYSMLLYLAGYQKEF